MPITVYFYFFFTEEILYFVYSIFLLSEIIYRFMLVSVNKYVGNYIKVYIHADNIISFSLR